MMQLLRNTLKSAFLLLFFTVAYIFITKPVLAVSSVPVGVHILSIDEISQAAELTAIPDSPDSWRYVTVPLTLSDLEKPIEWQAFFTAARKHKLVPLVRLTTSFSENSWNVPSRRNIVDSISFLSGLEWPTDQRHIIVFNEVNHSKEWGGYIDPEEYADIFSFTAQWAHTEGRNFVVLPAALDLAAPNGRQTMEAFTYLSRMHSYDPEIFSYADAWNSHSYPNPGFSASPERIGKNSLRGFQVELAWLSQKTGRDFKVYITETGWDASPSLARWLPQYYEYAVNHIWNDPNVIAVTPFILQGAPGPFEGFSFLTADGSPTAQYKAYKNALEKQYSKSDLLTAKIDIIE